jgi:hypothetical protein
MSNWAAWTGAVILLVVCILLVWAWRRLATLQAQVDSLSSAVNSLELGHQGSLVRFMNLPSPWPDTLEERMTVPTQPNER